MRFCCAIAEIKRAVGDDIEFRQICDGYTGFTYWNVLHDATKAGNFEICEFLIESVGVLVNGLAKTSYLSHFSLLLRAIFTLFRSNLGC